MKIKISTTNESEITTIGDYDCSKGFENLKEAVDFINTHGTPHETYILQITPDVDTKTISENLHFTKNMELKVEHEKFITITGVITVEPHVQVSFSEIGVLNLKIEKNRIYEPDFVPLIIIKRAKPETGTPTTTTTTSSSSTPSLSDRSFTPSITPPLEEDNEIPSIYVKTDGNDGNDGLTPATAKRTIQSAINNAPRKGSIIVSAGSYDENIVIKKSITLLGDNVFVNGGQKGSCIVCKEGTISITGFTIINGKSENGGGIYNNANLTLIESKIMLNAAELGAGIYNNSKLTLINSTISYNNATGNGGGIFTNTFLKVCRSQIAGNTAAHQGGGIYGPAGRIVTQNTNIQWNSSRQGGGIYSRSSVKIIDTEICSNVAETYGGGVYNAAEMDIVGGILRNNGTGKDGGGGAIYNIGTLKAGVNTVFMLNIGGLNGGAIYNKENSDMIIDNAIFTNNQGFNGGAIYNEGCTLIKESSYIGNIAINAGGAIYNNKTGHFVIKKQGEYDVPFDKNFAYNKGGAIYTKTELDLARISKGKNYPEFLIKETS